MKETTRLFFSFVLCGAIGAGIGFALFPAPAAPRLVSPALADEPIHWPCGTLTQAQSLAKAAGGEPFVEITHDQLEFVRGMFLMDQNTPNSIPPGDRALMSRRTDGRASIVFVDGEHACAMMVLTAEGVTWIMKVGEGDLVHVEDGL